MNKPLFHASPNTLKYEVEVHFTNRDPLWYECGRVYFKDSTVILRCLRYAGHPGPCTNDILEERTSTSEKLAKQT